MATEADVKPVFSRIYSLLYWLCKVGHRFSAIHKTIQTHIIKIGGVTVPIEDYRNAAFTIPLALRGKNNISVENKGVADGKIMGEGVYAFSHKINMLMHNILKSMKLIRCWLSSRNRTLLMK